MEPQSGIEPETSALPWQRSTTELLRLTARLYKQINLARASLFSSPFDKNSATNNKGRLYTVDPDVIGAVGHTVRLAAPKVRRDGSHKFCRPFVFRHFKRGMDIRQDNSLQGVDTTQSAKSPP